MTGGEAMETQGTAFPAVPAAPKRIFQTIETDRPRVNETLQAIHGIAGELKVQDGSSKTASTPEKTAYGLRRAMPRCLLNFG